MKIMAQPRGGGWWFGCFAVWLGLLAADAAAQRPYSLPGGSHRGGYRPAHLSAMHETVVSTRVKKQEPEDVIEEDEVVENGKYYENDAGELVLEHGPMASGPMLKGDCCGDGSCGSFGCNQCLLPCCIPVGSLEVFSGVQGFTGPVNRGGNGSFGFTEGVNWGIPLTQVNDCLSAQIGFRATQSNLSGTEFTTDSRYQTFVTAGLFRRVDCGMQGGVAIDWLNDDWYRDADLTQVRGELSWAYHDIHDVGVWFTQGTKNTTVNSRLSPTVNVSETWEATDMYAFFYRRELGECCQGYGRIFGGFTGQSDGLVGADCVLPLLDSCSLEAGFTYLIPKQSTGTSFDSGNVQESWNVSIALVWYPGKTWGAYNDYSRPLLRVADNGNFMVDRQ